VLQKKQELESKLQESKDQLTYINHFPPLWKYISLFPKNETESGEKGESEESK